MPYPCTTALTESIRGSVFSALAHRLGTFEGEVYPLHVGDTWLEPMAGARMEDLDVEHWPGLHRYSEPRGRADLLDRLSHRIGKRAGIGLSPDEVFVTAGATAGLFATLLTLIGPGDEVLILAPYWPLIEGIVKACRGVPVAVPTLDIESADELLARLDEKASRKTVALYFSTPNNPTGRVLPRGQVEALVEWATRRDLWIVADDVYEDYVYRGEHVSALGLEPERTITAYSFSKAFGMAGNRCGYVAGPKAALDEIRKVGTHTFYSTATASQLAANVVLDQGESWLKQARSAYRSLGDEVAEILGVRTPEGGTFLFVDVAPWLDERGVLGFLEKCAERGVFLAPGASFGPYPTFVRLCFTAAPPDVVRRGAVKLAELLARPSAAAKSSPVDRRARG